MVYTHVLKKADLAWPVHQTSFWIQMIEKTIKKVMPGQPGTKKLMKKYGEQLVIYHGRIHIIMTQQLLNGAYILSVLK